MASKVTQLHTVEMAISLPDALSASPAAAKRLLRFDSETVTHDYAIALSSLLHGTAETRLAIYEVEHGRDALDLEEINQLLRLKRTIELQFRFLFEQELPRFALSKAIHCNSLDCCFCDLGDF